METLIWRIVNACAPLALCAPHVVPDLQCRQIGDLYHNGIIKCQPKGHFKKRNRLTRSCMTALEVYGSAKGLSSKPSLQMKDEFRRIF